MKIIYTVTTKLEVEIPADMYPDFSLEEIKKHEEENTDINYLVSHDRAKSEVKVDIEGYSK